jgi:hypothetical protein
MKNISLAGCVIIILFGLDSIPALCRTEFDTIRLKDGTARTNVIVYTFFDDHILGICSTGNISISYNTIVKYDRNKIEKVFLEIQENKVFIKEQQDKGLIFFQGKWRTASDVAQLTNQQAIADMAKQQKQKEEKYDAKLENLVDSQSTNKATFKVIQNLKDGLLCGMGEWVYGTLYFSGEICFVESKGLSNQTVTAGTVLTEPLYWAGTYSYTTARNENKTVTRYYIDRSLAIQHVKENQIK